MNDIYSQASRVLDRVASQVPEGGELGLPQIQLAHFSVADTGLAACLATLGIPPRQPAPFTEDVLLDLRGNEAGKRVTWWFGDHAPDAREDLPHKTEELMAAWLDRAGFEKARPKHPLNWMRAALDARTWWLGVMNGREPLPLEAPVMPDGFQIFATQSIHAASLLKAMGFLPMALTAGAQGRNRAFILAGLCETIYPTRSEGKKHAEEVLQSALIQESQTPERFMACVLQTYSAMVKHTQSSSAIIRQRFEGDQTLMLSADADGKTKDKFYALL